jgi:carboxylesterase
MAVKPYGVLILHGYSASLDCVREIAPPLKDLGLPTRMPVLRGHNAESPEALRGVTWQDWVSDGETALNELLTVVDKVIVIGHSMGGLVALILAANYGEKLDSIILAAPAIQMSTPFAPGRPLNPIFPFLRIFFKNWDISQKAYADKSLAQYDTNYPWVPMDSIRELFEFSKVTRKRLNDVKIPLLIIQSHNDSTIMPVNVEIICNQISTPDEMKRVVWFEKTEHEMFRDCERYAIIDVITNYVCERTGITKQVRTV